MRFMTLGHKSNKTTKFLTCPEGKMGKIEEWERERERERERNVIKTHPEWISIRDFVLKLFI